MDELERRTGRDTRLLALVIVIAVGVLFGVARFRYPTATSTPPPQTPLERLAATGPFDDLAAAVRAALQDATPRVLLVDLEADGPAAEKNGTPPVRRRVVALRSRAGTAVVHVPTGFHVVLTPDVTVRKVDAGRQVAVLATTLVDEPAASRTAVEFTGFAYVAVVEAALGGPTARPVFIGRVDPVVDELWAGEIYGIASSPDIPAGAIVFTLEGRLVGFAMPARAGGTLLIPRPVLHAFAEAPPGEGR